METDDKHEEIRYCLCQCDSILYITVVIDKYGKVYGHGIKMTQHRTVSWFSNDTKRQKRKFFIL